MAEQPKIEVELIGPLTEDSSAVLSAYLDEHADAGSRRADDRRTVNFIIPRGQLKVVHRVSEGRAYISRKIGGLGTAQQECDVAIEPADFGKTVEMFVGLGFDERQVLEQRRVNYGMDGAEIAVKWSEDFGHHFEVERVVGSKAEVEEARAALLALCGKLGIVPYTQQELDALRESIDRKHRQAADARRAAGRVA